MNVRVVGSILVVAWAFQADALMITPSDTIPRSDYGPSNCEPGCVEDVFKTDDLTLLYKADVDKTGGALEQGPYALQYQTVFLDTATDPSGATISYVGGPSIYCGQCYLAVKGGKATGTAYYFFDLSAWNGTDALTLSSFWPDKGAISHVAIWGDHVSVPEPATLSLLGVGLLLVGFRGRKKLLG